MWTLHYKKSNEIKYYFSDKVITPEKLLKMMKISLRTIYRILEKGKLPFAMKIAGSWRFFEKDVIQYMIDSKIHSKVLHVLDEWINDLMKT